MKRTRKIFSLVLAVMMILSILPIHAAASGEGTYDIAAPGGVITAEKGTISDGKAADGAILSIALDPAAFPAYTFDHWESAYGDVIPQESFRVLVDKDAYFFPVFADAAPHFGEWTLVKAGESCEDGDLYMRTDPESGLVEYSFRLFNYGNHDFGEYEYYDEEYCAATCSHCGYVDLVEHNWSEEMVVREATHSVPGLTRKTCYRCGKTIDTEIPVTSNHSWGAWEIVTPSVNGQPGVRRRTCTECSESEECWYIKADWKGYYDDSRITFLGNYNNQYGSMKEGHYSFINNDGKRAYVYGASWADKNAERVVMFMWIDDPDELGRRPIYHAKTMVNGWGYGWALLAYADTFDEYISFIDNLYLDRSTV
ncbi:MAG: hypothetical protein II727_11055, partial [Oscillospiraceae bacterium]|nr:hypothetical protein [Oscillospiraceae bacterium]